MNSTDAYSVATQTLRILMPEVLIMLVATAMMTAGAFVRLPRRAWSITSAVTFLVAMLILMLHEGLTIDAYSAVALNDALSWYARVGFVLTGLILLALAHDQVDESRASEFFGAFLMIHAGAMLVATANELVFLFVGLELVSIPTYFLLYLPRRNMKTLEAATKYFYLSVFSSGLFLFGLAYLYGLTGVSNLKALSFLLHWRSNALAIPVPILGAIAAVFIIAGLGFRMAAVPFHFYAPDVYEGSPTVVAALLSWIPKAIGAIALLRVLAAVFGWDPALLGVSNIAMVSDKAVALCWVIAVVTMTLGNTVALMQENLKRLLAYSSISHAGYLMVGLTVALRNGPGDTGAFLGSYGIVFYLAAYALMTLGAFGVIIALSSPEKEVETVEDLAGLVKTQPWAAMAMALCLFSLAGVPPMAGFLGKFWIFGSVIASARGDDETMFLLLAVIGVLNAAIGAYYYLRIVVKMAFWPSTTTLQPRAAWPTVVAVAACAGLSLVLGCYPAPLIQASRESAAALLDQPDPGPDSVETATAPSLPVR